MAVLKVEGVEKLLGLLLIQFSQRFFHRERRARVLGHGVGLHLRIGALHAKNDRFRRPRPKFQDLELEVGYVLIESGPCRKCKVSGKQAQGRTDFRFQSEDFRLRQFRRRRNFSALDSFCMLQLFWKSVRNLNSEIFT